MSRHAFSRAPIVLVETRGPDLARTGQIHDRDITDLVGIVRWRNVGTWSLTLPEGSPAAARLRVTGAGIIITLDGDVLLSGPVVNITRTVKPADRVDEWTFDGVSDEVHLADRLAWPSPATTDVTAQPGTNGTGHDRRTGATESLMRAYVSANLGPAAPVARRVTGLTLAAEHVPPLGPTVIGTARFQTLTETLNSLSAPPGLGYGVRQLGGQLVFEVLQPRDLSASVQFDPLNDTVDEVTYTYGVHSVSRAIVAGPGEMAAREHVERTSADSLEAESTWARRIERYIDRRDVAADDPDKATRLQQAGDEALAEGGQTVVGLQLTPSDTLSVRFRRDWYVGDRPAVFLPGITEPTTVTTPVVRYYGVTDVHTAIDAATTFAELEAAVRPFGQFYGLTVDVLETAGQAGYTGTFQHAALTMTDFDDAKALSKIMVEEFAKYPPSFVLASELEHIYLVGTITNTSTGGFAGGLAHLDAFWLNATYNVVASPATYEDYYRGLIHHEWAHIIAHSWLTEYNALFNPWESLNPAGSREQYGEPFTGDHPPAYVSNYARFNRAEDWADTHSYLTAAHAHDTTQAWIDSDWRLRGKADLLRDFLTARDPAMANFHARANQEESTQTYDAMPITGTITEAHFAYGPDGFRARAVLGDPDVIARKPLLKAIREQRDQARRLSRLERR